MTLGVICILQDGLQSSSTCNKVTHFGAASHSLWSKLSVISKLKSGKDCFIILVLGLVMGPPTSCKLSLPLLVGSLSVPKGEIRLLDSAQNLVKEVKKIFYAMKCIGVHKVMFSTYMLVEEVKYWWENTRTHLEVEGCPREKRRWSFLSTIHTIRVMQFPVLVNKCRIYDEDNRAKVAHYNGGVGLMKGKQYGGQTRSKPCSTLSFKHKGSISITQNRCLKYGRLSHYASKCMDKEVTCSNYGKQGHIVRNYKLSKKESSSAGRSAQSNHSKTTKRVFSLSNVEVTTTFIIFIIYVVGASLSENLTQGTCFPLIVLFNSKATHLFITHDFVFKLELPMSPLKFKLVIEIPTNGSNVTSHVYLQCPLNVLD
ncbi:hypothetical protein CR513_04420, partial [Mucuna pruriens]